ncbi:MAG: TIGR00730 family Rossman fold protein [Chloroflexi bacterium]|nr:TIGR00730 family Rossman fold protein [Chloroflexota bacterium]
MSKITVFASSSSGDKPEYAQAAQELGMAIALRGITLVYGANKDGLAGMLARAVKDAGGHMIGVMPKFLVDQGRAFDRLDEFHIANDLHEHKKIMSELGDAFIGLPGGLGTLEEFFEILTWAQLGIHCKPCGLLNICGFYDPLLAFMDQVRESWFIDQRTRELIITSASSEGLINQLLKFKS